MNKDLLKQKEVFIEEEEIDLLDLLKTIYKSRKMIAIIISLTTVVGISFALLSTRQYTSHMTFFEEKSMQGSSSLSAMAGGLPFGMGSNLGKDSNLLYILESRTFKEKIAESLDLRNYLIEQNEMDEEAQEEFGVHDLIRWMNSIIRVSIDSSTSVYKVEVTMEDKEKATEIANEYFYILDSYLKNEKLSKNKINMLFLEKQLKASEKELDERQKELKAYEEKYNTVNIDADARIVAESVASIKGRILETETNYNLARRIYGDNNLEVNRLKSSLEELKRQLRNLEEGTGIVNFIPLNEIPTIKYELEKMKTEIATMREVTRMLKVKLEQAKLEEINERSVISILDKAIEPKYPSGRGRKIIVIISFILGSFLAIFITFTKEFIKKIDWSEFKN